MKKKTMALLLTLALLLSQLSVFAYAADGGKNAADARSGVVRIVSVNPDGTIASGSGFAVGKVGEETDTFITNHHVVYGDYKTQNGTMELPAVQVYILKNNSAWNAGLDYPLDTAQCIPCEIIYAEPSGLPDMAIIKAAEKVPGRYALPLLSDPEKLEAGDSIYALGYPGSSDDPEGTIYSGKKLAEVKDVTITSGVASRLTTATAWGNTRIIQHDAQINHGNSGGPLLNENGVVLGINTWIFGQDLSTGDGQSYASVRIDHVMKVMDELGIYYETDEGSAALVIILVALVVVILAAVVVFFYIKKKKNANKTSAADRAPRLQGVTGVFAGKRFSINGSVRLGRDPSKNDLVYPNSTQGISGVHCVIVLDGNTVYLKDLGSTYGTFLGNGQRLAANESVALKVGDRFWLGSENEVFMIDSKGGN